MGTAVSNDRLPPPMTEMTKSPLSGVGEGGAYIARTVDKVSFVIFLMKAQ